MGLINFILNLAALLLWLGWRDARASLHGDGPGLPLSRTLRPLGRSDLLRWKYLGALLALLPARALLYHWIGPTMRWTPGLDLGVIVPPFRSELFSRMLWFSVFSFGLTLACFYLSVLFLSIVNRRVPDIEPLQKIVRGYLGRVERWPTALKIFLPLAVAVGVWVALSPLLVWLDIVPAAPAWGVRIRQGFLIGVGMCLKWKHVVASVLLLHFLNSHIYFGNHPLWTFVTVTARQMLSPLRRLPLRIGRVDFAPVVAIVAVYLVTQWMELGMDLRLLGLHSHLPGLKDFFACAA